MKRFALAATLAATAFAAPAFADGHATNFAIMHFNMDADNADQFVMLPQGDTVQVDLEMGTTLAEVFAHLNMSAETMGDLVGQSGTVTILASDPAHAAEIFSRLMEEGRGEE
ncbi:hypothetical protein [Jannaschia sp. CCS1]|uniref:hypothetical protein n=1 Tax=Jannaschia sp. (strain CCS1) TaxID=290400 RepID=UPI000053D7E8|nr:hypothetical protein [Jannaschia sp. CCS1]ABD52991.1 hypothetical protein Jann_0074 [Jannaschia sp. CCS1]